MNNPKLIQLIRESINEYIREIDHAGEEAAVSAKIAKIGEAIESREKKMNMEGIDEAYHDMIDKSKMKELSGEVKALKKSLAKYEKQLEKLKNKGEKVTKVEDTEEKEEIIDEVSIDENEGMEYEGMGMEMGDERFDADGTPNEEGMYDAEGNRISFADIDKAMYDGEAEYMNESFLHMQKLAGVITEAQYKQKIEILNEDKLVLSNYAKQLYSLFKKSGATPLIQTGAKGFASPDVKNYNVSILVTNNDELMVGIKGDKATATNYSNLVAKQFPDLQLKGDIKIGTGWGGEKDSYADLILIPKTTKKGGDINPNQRPNTPKPTV